VAAPLLGLLALATTAIGALGGLGGAILLVPLAVLFGVPASQAAPLGLLSVAAGSLAAGAHQLRESTVNHRIGVVTELGASTGAVAGALLSGAVSDEILTRALAVVAVAAAFAGGRRKGVRNPPSPACSDEDVGEWEGTLAGAYRVGGGVAPYEAKRVAAGVAAIALSGVAAGVAGVSGGFIKTPATTELMHVPVKVAAATTTFTIGITSATALAVFAVQGRIDVGDAAPVIVGSLVGGTLGAVLQARLQPPVVRRALSVVLVLVALVLVTR
jgi:uncharacterized membrane protein YfcA